MTLDASSHFSETIGDDTDDAAVPVRVYVCTTCTDRRRGPGGRCGAIMYAELTAKTRDPGIDIVPVSCLGVCEPNCAVSFAAEGKWTYVFAIPSETELAVILEGARLYAEARSDVMPWGTCPSVLKRGAVSRVPPMKARKD